MQKILSTLRKAVEKYKLIEDGDKIAIGLSGGKDSLVLLRALSEFKKFGLYNFDIVAVTIDIYSGKVDYSELKKFCDDCGVELYIEPTDIQHIVFDLRQESNPCSLCAKMRRGALNSVCQKLGCNKLALGHHMQDVITTFFMSLLFEGRLSTMMPKSYMSNSKITLIRPLYLTHEERIKFVSKNYPILKSICPADKDSKRRETKELVDTFEKFSPNAKKLIESALISPERYNLLNKNFENLDDN